MRTAILLGALFGALVAAPAVVHANPRALPFTYTTDTLQPGGVEIEQYADLVPLVAFAPTGGGFDHFLASEFFTELEIGLRDRLELGLYFTFVPSARSQAVELPEGNGLKQRLRYIFADPGKWPVDVGVYGELSEAEDEIEFEAKVLLQRRFGRVRVASNLTGEYEWNFSGERDLVIDPSLGVTAEITPALHAGIDSWLRAEYRQDQFEARAFENGPEAYVGPAVMASFGKLWWTVGVYARVTDPSHDLQPGEIYGRVWVRSMIGYQL